MMQVPTAIPALTDIGVFIAGLAATVAMVLKWILPALRNGGRHTNGHRETEAEWRGKVTAQLQHQESALAALLGATTAIEKLLIEIERRTTGSDHAIRSIAEISPKLDLLLRREMRP